MAHAPTCIKCGSNVFEIEPYTPSGAAIKLNFVQCAECGGVIGVLDQYNIGAMLKLHGSAMKKLAAKARVKVDLPD
jgi:hypothetical protein